MDFLSSSAAAACPPSASCQQAANTPATASRRVICRLATGSCRFMNASICIELHAHFVYHQTMNVIDDADVAVSRIAAAIGEPARARILYCLMDGRARTSTELAVVAGVTPSTASVHLGRLKDERLIDVLFQGKHRYY